MEFLAEEIVSSDVFLVEVDADRDVGEVGGVLEHIGTGDVGGDFGELLDFAFVIFDASVGVGFDNAELLASGCDHGGLELAVRIFVFGIELADATTDDFFGDEAAAAVDEVAVLVIIIELHEDEVIEILGLAVTNGIAVIGTNDEDNAILGGIAEKFIHEIFGAGERFVEDVVIIDDYNDKPHFGLLNLVVIGKGAVVIRKNFFATVHFVGNEIEHAGDFVDFGAKDDFANLGKLGEFFESFGTKIDNVIGDFGGGAFSDTRPNNGGDELVDASVGLADDGDVAFG